MQDGPASVHNRLNTMEKQQSQLEGSHPYTRAELLQHLHDLLLRDQIQLGAHDAEGLQVEHNRNREQFASESSQAQCRLHNRQPKFACQHGLGCDGAGRCFF